MWQKLPVTLKLTLTAARGGVPAADTADSSAGDDGVVRKEDDGLTAGYSALRGVEFDAELALACHCYNRGDFLVTVAYLRGDAHRAGERLYRDEVQLVRVQPLLI